jgi:hypothetical protein
MEHDHIYLGISDDYRRIKLEPTIEVILGVACIRMVRRKEPLNRREEGKVWMHFTTAPAACIFVR